MLSNIRYLITKFRKMIVQYPILNTEVYNLNLITNILVITLVKIV